MANVSTNVLNLLQCSKQTVIDSNDFANASVHIRSIVSQLVVEQLNSLDLIECVIRLADTSVADDVKVFLDMMTGKVPELVFLGLLQIEVKKKKKKKKKKKRIVKIRC
jgi:CCR4-NOT transcription complex subunit 1